MLSRRGLRTPVLLRPVSSADRLTDPGPPAARISPATFRGVGAHRHASVEGPKKVATQKHKNPGEPGYLVDLLHDYSKQSPTVPGPYDLLAKAVGKKHFEQADPSVTSRSRERRGSFDTTRSRH